MKPGGTIDALSNLVCTKIGEIRLEYVLIVLWTSNKSWQNSGNLNAKLFPPMRVVRTRGRMT